MWCNSAAAKWLPILPQAAAGRRHAAAAGTATAAAARAAAEEEEEANDELGSKLQAAGPVFSSSNKLRRKADGCRRSKRSPEMISLLN